MLRRQVLAGALYALCGAATAASSQSAEVMEGFFRKFGTEGRTYILRESPLDATDSPGASRALLREFPVRQTKLRRRDFGSVSVRLLTDAEFIDIFADGKGCSAGWAEFHKRYPNSKALLQFSAVRFTKGGDEAHVLVQVSSACLGGTIDKCRFLRQGSLWHFADSENLGRA
jgi:hypothetical protein